MRPRQLASQHRADRTEADVHAAKEQHQPDIGIRKADQYARPLPLLIAVRRQLENHKDRDNRQDGHGDLQNVMRETMHEFPRNVLCRNDLRNLRRRIYGVLRIIKASEQRNRQNRADARQRNQTEAVIRRVLITANRRHAYAHRHDERHRNRPRRHAARVIGNAQKILRHKD